MCTEFTTVLYWGAYFRNLLCSILLMRPNSLVPVQRFSPKEVYNEGDKLVSYPSDEMSGAVALWLDGYEICRLVCNSLS